MIVIHIITLLSYFSPALMLLNYLIVLTTTPYKLFVVFIEGIQYNIIVVRYKLQLFYYKSSHLNICIVNCMYKMFVFYYNK